MLETMQKKEYDFAGKNPNDILTQDELSHFDEGMSLKNESIPANKIDFGRAVQSVAQDMDRLFP